MGKQNQFLRLTLWKKDQEIALGLLFDLGLTTLVEKQYKKQNSNRLLYEVALPQKPSAVKLIQALQNKEKKISQKVFLKKEIIQLKDENWKIRYEKFLHPFYLPIPKGDYPYPPILINPNPKRSIRKTNHMLKIRAQSAFGTGVHPSTQLASLLLQELLWHPSQASVLDMGTGSGILAMIAKMRGAKKVWAIENDLEALAIAKKNFQENHLMDIKTAAKLKKSIGSFDIIVANILAPTLIDLKQSFKKHLKRGGVLILSGLTYRDIPDIKNSYQDWKLHKRLNQKGWSALSLQN